MPSYEAHEPSYDDTTTDDWDSPQENDFDTDDLGDVAEHFVLSSSGFPPENYGDLSIPVVDPDGRLNRNALQTARRTGHGIDSVDDLDDDVAAEAKEIVDRLVEREFPDAEATDPPS